ncbi:MAG: asparagine synthase (glutamine-hydrolyzing) [Patescibacteria group bacterium]
MCGIAGIIGGDQELIRKMTAAIRHRGPDDEGFFQDGDVFLGHRRLSIIDLAGGRQPFLSADGKSAVVFNGEIYNFKELKKELSRKHSFRSQSDTEVVLEGWLEWGQNIFERLEGMFAIGIWDGRNKTLVLARDRMGEKPLYYCASGDFFAFASELKSFIASRAAPKEIDPESVIRYLSFGYIPSPYTIFKNIYKLEAGQYLVWQNGRADIKRYWQPSFSPARIPDSFESAKKKLELALENTVKKTMIADVPVGVFLSGGLDSSLIAYFAKKINPQLETFSIGFEEKSFDESFYAGLAARILKTRHYQKIVGPKEVLNLLPRIAEIIDEPFADPSIIPTYILSAFARQRVKTVLGGDGGDELFLGYQTFIAEKLWRMSSPFLPAASVLAKAALRLIPTSGKYMSLDFKLRRFFSNSRGGPVLRHQQWLANFNSEDLDRILSNDMKNSFLPFKIAEGAINDPIGNLNGSSWNQIIRFYQKFYLGDQVLTKVDRASMANSLEVRAPFLNHNLAEFVLSLPVNFRLRGFKTKYILRKIAAGYFPKNIAWRSKQGFAVPLGKWFRNELKEFAEEKLSHFKSNPWFNPPAVDGIWTEHQTGRADRRMEIWNMIVFQSWLEKWGL